jgi:hypothetical protein
MSTTVQSITLPTCDSSTPLDAFPSVIAAYHEAIAGTVALDTITQVAEAVRDASAVVVKYVDGKGSSMRGYSGLPWYR